MARRPQTRLAVLGALAVEPATGYGVRAAITDTLGHFWHESFGQIYPTLAALEEERLVRRTRDDKFAITAAGRSELRRLLAEPPEPARPRNALMLRLFFGSHLPAEARAELLQDAYDQATAAMAEYERFEHEALVEDHPDSEHWLTTIRYGIHIARATQAWAKEELGRASP